MADNIWIGITSVNWGTATNWSLGAVPTANDGNVARFNLASPNCTVNSSVRACNAIDFTGYVATITMSQAITVSGNITLGAAMLMAGTGVLSPGTASTITSNGITWSAGWSFGGSSLTHTLADVLRLSGPWTQSSPSTVNGNTIQMSGTFTCAGGSGTVLQGNTTLNLIGTFTWAGGTGSNRLNTNINAGNFTLGGNTIYGGQTLKYIAGTPTVTGHSLQIISACTLDLVGIDFNNYAVLVSTTITLTTDLAYTGAYSNTGAVVYNGASLIVKGSITTGGSNPITGTGKVVFKNGSSWLGVTGSIRVNIDIDCGAGGSTTFTGTPNYSVGVFTRVSGTVINTAAVFTILSTCTINTNTIDWDNVVVSQGVITFSSLFHGTNLTWGATGSPTFTGASGIDFDSLLCDVAGRILFLKAGNTYVINTQQTTKGTLASPCSIISLTASSDTFINFGATCVIHNFYTNLTDINASGGGRPMYTERGTLLRTTNCYRTRSQTA